MKWKFRLVYWSVLFICLSLWLLATLRENYSSDPPTNFTRNVTLDKADTAIFFESSASRIFFPKLQDRTFFQKFGSYLWEKTDRISIKMSTISRQGIKFPLNFGSHRVQIRTGWGCGPDPRWRRFAFSECSR